MSNPQANTYRADKSGYNYKTIVSLDNIYIDDYLHSQIVKVTSAKCSIILPSIEIGRIMFIASEKDGAYILFNSQWPSLTLGGASLSKVIANMMELIYTVDTQYVLEFNNGLTEDGIEFKKFLLSRIFC